MGIQNSVIILTNKKSINKNQSDIFEFRNKGKRNWLLDKEFCKIFRINCDCIFIRGYQKTINCAKLSFYFGLFATDISSPFAGLSTHHQLKTWD